MLLDTFQTVGAGIGILTALFSMWAFLTKAHPSARLVGAPVGGFGRRTVYLRVQNPGTRPILLVLHPAPKDRDFTIWPDHELDSAVSAALREETTIALDPGEGKLLPVVPPRGFDEAAAGSKARYRLSWRFAQSGWIGLSMPLTGSIAQADYVALEQGLRRGSRPN